MIIDLPPHIEQVIIATAEKRGLTLGEMFAQDYAKQAFADNLMADRAGIITDTENTRVSEEQFEFLMGILDNPPPKTEAMKRLLALREQYV